MFVGTGCDVFRDPHLGLPLMSINATCRQSYNLHPFVKNGILTLALNGTLTSSDLVNVTVTVRNFGTF